MTATMSADALALCAAIDTGDDVALLALADAMEEAGSQLARGLRLVLVEKQLPLAGVNHYRWEGRVSPTDSTTGWGAYVPRQTLDRMVGGTLCPEESLPDDPPEWWHWREYPTRSAALLALAEALA
jgi:hypothetical protein